MDTWRREKASRPGPIFKALGALLGLYGWFRHAGHGPWDDTVRAVLGLSKMNWNNDALYDSLPVTMAYAKVLSRVVKRMPSLGENSLPIPVFHVIERRQADRGRG